MRLKGKGVIRLKGYEVKGGLMINDNRSSLIFHQKNQLRDG